MNVSKDRQEVAKRKKSQLASSSLAGILPAPAQKQHSPQDVLIACGRPGSPQQQTDIAGALSPSRPAAPGHVRPASAAAVYGTRLGTMAGSPERVWPLTTHNSDAACGSGGKSSGNTHTTKSPSSLSPDRARATQQVLVEKARPASLTTAGPAALGVAGSGSSNGWKTAYQAYEDRPVGGGSTNKAGEGALLLTGMTDRWPARCSSVSTCALLRTQHFTDTSSAHEHPARTSQTYNVSRYHEGIGIDRSKLLLIMTAITRVLFNRVTFLQ